MGDKWETREQHELANGDMRHDTAPFGDNFSIFTRPDSQRGLRSSCYRLDLPKERTFCGVVAYESVKIVDTFLGHLAEKFLRLGLLNLQRIRLTNLCECMYA
eukprot:52754-Amorphochlora_amoeboformis.AAC.1